MDKGLRPGVVVNKPKCRKRKVEPLTIEEKKLVEGNMDIASFAAYRAVTETRGYVGCFTFEDLKAVAFYALCVAAKDFDPSKGFSFRTYAARKAQGYIQHALRDTSRIVKIPRYIFKYREEVRKLMGEGLSGKEIAETLGISYDKVVECEESWGQIHLSLDSSNTEGEEEPSSIDIPSYNPDEVELMGRSVLAELGKLPEEVIELLNQYHYGDSSSFSEWELKFCQTFFEQYRNKIHRGIRGK